MHGPPPYYNRTIIGASPAKETIGLGREEMLCCLNLVTIDKREKENPLSSSSPQVFQVALTAPADVYFWNEEPPAPPFRCSNGAVDVRVLGTKWDGTCLLLLLLLLAPPKRFRLLLVYIKCCCKDDLVEGGMTEAVAPPPPRLLLVLP